MDQNDVKEKACSRCKEIKPLSSFSKDKQHGSGHKSACKSCASKYFNSWRQKNLEQVRIKDRLISYKRKYNLSDEMAEQLVKDRTGVCKICGKIKPLVVDHCHSTGEVRGLICSACNSVLGYSKDNVNTLKQAIKYLKDFYGSE